MVDGGTVDGNPPVGKVQEIIKVEESGASNELDMRIGGSPNGRSQVDNGQGVVGTTVGPEEGGQCEFLLWWECSEIRDGR